MTAQEETARRMQAEYERNMERKANFLDEILETAKTDQVEAAQLLCEGLMRGDPDQLRLGYSIGSALIATLEMLERNETPLTTTQIGLLVERIAEPKLHIVEYGPTYRG